MATYYTTNVYPIQFDVDYPDKSLDRVSTLLRGIYFLPIFVVLALISGIGLDFNLSLSFNNITCAGGLLIAPSALMVLFRKKYPRWWFDFNLALLQFANRVLVYLLLLTDVYPSSEDEQSVHLNIAYPDADWSLNRFMPLFKWIFAIPHYLSLIFLTAAVAVVTVTAWGVILFTGKYPRPMFNFVVNVMRLGNRVVGYAIILVTDDYPPLRLGV